MFQLNLFFFSFVLSVASNDLAIEVIQKDEKIDCQVVELIRDNILNQSNNLPQQFVQKVLAILNRGSIYSNPFENFLDLDTSRKHREEFSKTCFEALLSFSFVNANNDAATSNNTTVTSMTNNSNGSLNGDGTVADGNLTRMALSSMLTRCKEIVQRYAHDERLNGSTPLPRPRINEMICVLRALCTLISALKKAPKESSKNSN